MSINSLNEAIHTLPIEAQTTEYSSVKSLKSMTSDAIVQIPKEDYSLHQIVSLEKALKQIKTTFGNQSPQYLQLKNRLNEVREMHLPFRSYVASKREKKQGPPMIGRQEIQVDLQSSNLKAKKEKWIEIASSPEIEKKLKILSQITFLHGSNSSALLIMALSECPELQCVGTLISRGIAPMYGEILIKNRIGVNGLSISAETIRDIPRVMGYSSQKTFLFNPEQLDCLINPYLMFDRKAAWELKYIGDNLNSWKKSDPKGYEEALGIGTPKNQLFLDAFNIEIASQKKILSYLENDPFSMAARDYQYLLKNKNELLLLLESHVKSLQTGSDFSGNGNHFAEVHWGETRDQIQNPKTLHTGESNWNKLAILLLQFKQWDYPAFQEQISSNLDEWQKALEQEKLKQEKPLKQLIAMIDHPFTDEEKQFLLKVLQNKALPGNPPSSDTPIPEDLTELFSSIEEIPYARSRANFTLRQLKREIELYRNGNYHWIDILHQTLKAKIEGSNEDLLPAMKLIYEEEIRSLHKNYKEITSALIDPPRVQIPSDENTRSLLMNPIPVIFGSTTVKPEPHVTGSEYNLAQPIPLGKGGCDILFTDTLESKAKIEALLPERLKEEITIHLFDTFDVGGIPLIHASYQIDKAT